MTPATLAAALLHDTVEDTAYTLEQLREGLRPRGRDARRRRHQARQGELRRRRAGRDRAQDGRRDGPGHPRPGHQARRPAAQRAHLALRLGRVRPAQGPRDPRDLRPAGPPARHEHHQVGARGPVLRDALPQGLRRDRAAGGRARAGPRGVPRHGARAGQRRPAGGQDQGHGDGPAQALLLRLPEDDRARPRLRGHLRPGRGPRARRLGARLLRGARCPARAVEPGAGAVQGLHRDAEVQHVPVAAHDGDRPGRQAGRDPDPHARHAPPRRVRRRRALEVQGGRHRARGRRGRQRPHQRHGLAAPAARLAEGDGRPRRVPRLAALRDQRPRGLRLHAQGRRHGAARPARPRSTSRTPCTPRSGTTASARGSTAGWCRWSRRSRTATSSRCSPPRPTAPARRATG